MKAHMQECSRETQSTWPQSGGQKTVALNARQSMALTHLQVLMSHGDEL